MRTKFAQSARRHKVGRGSVIFVMNASDPTITVDPITGLVTRSWIDVDERGRELQIAAIEVTDKRKGDQILLVTHVMPTHLRRR